MKGRFISPQPFLFELILVIFFFAFASVISLQVFVKASNLSQDSVALQKSILEVQSTAEADKTLSQEDLNWTIRSTFFDKNWAETDESNASYTLVTQVDFSDRWSGTMVNFDYKMYHGKTLLYELTSKKYYTSSASLQGGDINE